MKLIHGDCLEVMRGLQENSVDAIVTDPPYGLSFMGKKWDYDVPSIEIWKECLRVLKPGGYLLAFAGTRTQHRMAVRIEDAGFEIRDMIAWIYGVGFPKSLSIGKAVNSLETKEWSAIGKALDNADQKSIMEAWKSNSDGVKIVETQSLKNQITVGQDTPSENFVQENVAESINQIKLSLNVNTAEKYFIVLQAINIEEDIVRQNVEKIITEINELQNPATIAENLQQKDLVMQSMNIFTAQCDVKEWLNENTEVNHKVDEALKTLRGNKKYSNEEITNVVCAVLTNALKLTILNQSKTFQNLDTKSKMDYASAINVIITEYTAENLISNTVTILKSKQVDKLQGNEREDLGEKVSSSYPDSDGVAYYKNRSKSEGSQVSTGGMPRITKGTSEWEGWGTALKPAVEPVSVCSKPLTLLNVFSIMLLELTNNIKEICQKYNVNASDVEQIFQSINQLLERAGVNTVHENAKTLNWENIEGAILAAQHFTQLNQQSQGKDINKDNFAQENVRENGKNNTLEKKTQTGEVENLNGVDIFISELMGNMSENIVLLWKNILEEILNQANTYTTSMAIKKTIELKTLKSFLCQSISKDTGSSSVSPALEPITVARKPLSEKNVAENVLKWGTGGMNIDGCRVEGEVKSFVDKGRDAQGTAYNWSNTDRKERFYDGTQGRFPANLCWSCDCDNDYLMGNALSDILGNISNQIKLCQSNNLNSNALNVEQKKHQQDTTSEEKKLCFAVENVDTLILEKILGKTLEVIFSVDTECSVEMLEESMNTSLSISLSGNEKMEEYQKVLKYITLTVTNLIIELKTCNLSQSQIIGNFITKVISGIREQSRVKSHSPECWVRECFPNGSESFFKSIIYQAKTSKKERNMGCEGMANNKPVYESYRPNCENTHGIETPYAGAGRTGNANQNNHPTVKPIALMRYLCRLVTQKGGIVLDPFMGSGTTGIAAKLEGFDFIGIEKEEDYIKIAQARIDAVDENE